jgi:hypothetical protein
MTRSRGNVSIKRIEDEGPDIFGDESKDFLSILKDVSTPGMSEEKVDGFFQ